MASVLGLVTRIICVRCGRGADRDATCQSRPRPRTERWRPPGGSDFDLDLLVALCRWCHDQTDAPYERGRLVVTALGAGQFTFEVVQRARRGPLKPGPTFAHVGKIHPVDDDRDWSVLG
jgi:hypothetical protein